MNDHGGQHRLPVWQGAATVFQSQLAVHSMLTGVERAARPWLCREVRLSGTGEVGVLACLASLHAPHLGHSMQQDQPCTQRMLVGSWTRPCAS